MLIAATLVWSLAAFGGAYAWTLPPVYLLVGALLVLGRPRIARASNRFLDIALSAAMIASGAQLIPLPPAVRSVLSPHAAVFDGALRFDAGGGWRPLSVDPTATLTWLPAGCAAVALFWAARASFTGTSVRRAARAIAWAGLVVGPLVIVQHYSSPHLIYWTFRPVDAGGMTAGPFVNRNHMATWLLLALPTTVGYLIARASAHAESGRDGVSAAVSMFEEPRTFWLIAAAVAMLAALITSLSRSGLIGLAAGVAVGMLLPQFSGRAVHRRSAIAIVVAALAVGIALANTGALLSRFEQAGTDPVGGRLAIWRHTLPMVRNFALTGVGTGAYGTAMLAYQQQRRYGFFYNQAHNQYLQFATEGGLLVGVPILLVIVAFSRAAMRALAADHSPIFWMRAGAVAAIVAVAIQSIWETGLRMPANALLAAVVAAIAVHDRRH